MTFWFQLLVKSGSLSRSLSCSLSLSLPVFQLQYKLHLLLGEVVSVQRCVTGCCKAGISGTPSETAGGEKAQRSFLPHITEEVDVH